MHRLRRVKSGLIGQLQPVQRYRCRRGFIAVNGTNDQDAQSGVVGLDVTHVNGAARYRTHRAGRQPGGFAQAALNVGQSGCKLVTRGGCVGVGQP